MGGAWGVHFSPSPTGASFGVLTATGCDFAAVLVALVVEDSGDGPVAGAGCGSLPALGTGRQVRARGAGGDGCPPKPKREARGPRAAFSAEQRPANTVRPTGQSVFCCCVPANPCNSAPPVIAPVGARRAGRRALENRRESCHRGLGAHLVLRRLTCDILPPSDLRHPSADRGMIVRPIYGRATDLVPGRLVISGGYRCRRRCAGCGIGRRPSSASCTCNYRRPQMRETGLETIHRIRGGTRWK